MIQPERFHRIRAVLDRRQPDLTVVMDRVNKEHNFSAILRNCDAVGVLEVHAVPPRHGLRLSEDTSAGAKKWIRVHRHPDGPTALAAVRSAGFQIVAAHPGAEARDFREVDFTQPTALLLGAEKWGITPESLAYAQVLARIPMVGMVKSLNVSVAASLLLYEAQRQRMAAGLYDPERSRLSREGREKLLFEWAYPKLARHLRDQGLPYPPLGPDGEWLESPASLPPTGS
jgi:tRNA (guanosine-2'-O-)-methyltransferase